MSFPPKPPLSFRPKWRDLFKKGSKGTTIFTSWGSYTNSVLYIGVTNNLKRRVYEHREGLVDGFTKKYNIKKLLYYEETTDIKVAIKREKQIKKRRREKKENLIKKTNPHLKDLGEELLSGNI